jgi:hypothetical protein
VDAEGAGLVGAGCDNPALPGAADDDRTTHEFWVVEQFHRGEEGVHVDMQDGGLELTGAIVVGHGIHLS